MHSTQGRARTTESGLPPGRRRLPFPYGRTGVRHVLTPAWAAGASGRTAVGYDCPLACKRIRKPSLTAWQLPGNCLVTTWHLTHHSSTGTWHPPGRCHPPMIR
eukprot:9467124-Pyramimonas_sp.AAC.1